MPAKQRFVMLKKAEELRHLPAIKGGAIIDHETPRERRIVAVEK
jgi:hypothetical protein